MKVNSLQGKKILFIDGSLCVIDAIERAHALGVKTVVANYFSEEIAPAKKYADEAVDIDFTDLRIDYSNQYTWFCLYEI